MGLLLEICWIALIVFCVVSTIVVAMMESSRRKKAYESRMVAQQDSGESSLTPDAMDNLDDFGNMPSEPDFDFTNNK